MKQKYTGFTIDHKFFTEDELEEFCRKQIAENKSPDWKRDVYRFILNFSDDSEFIQQQTSGSTGTPKTIQLSKKAMLESAKSTAEYFKLKENQVAVLCLPVKYIAGKMMIVRALFARLNLILIEPSGTPDFSGTGKVDFCAMVPMQAANLVAQNKWPDIKTLLVGGAETSPKLTAKLQKVKTEVFETYGMAETCSHIAIKRINGENREQHFTVLPGIKVSKDERGCLEIEAHFLHEKLSTSDCVELFSENQFRWLGRLDNVINSGGIKIQPEILEEQIGGILQLPCAIIGLPDELLGQKLVLVLETEQEINSEKIQQTLSSVMDKKSIPKAVFFLPELPRNKSFKIDRRKLKGLISVMDQSDSGISADFLKK